MRQEKRIIVLSKEREDESPHSEETQVIKEDLLVSRFLSGSENRLKVLVSE